MSLFDRTGRVTVTLMIFFVIITIVAMVAVSINCWERGHSVACIFSVCRCVDEVK